MAYASVAVEGGLFPADLLDRIAAGQAEGQHAADFRVNGTRRLADEIQSAFSDARSFWDAFQRRLQRSRESRTTITREAWMTSFLELLGFDRLVAQRTSAEAGGATYFISHRAGDDPDAPPVHIVALDQELDRREGAARRSPHALVQEYLNRSDAVWGIATNGRRLRLLRDSVRLAKPTYLEFDLEGMIEGNLYSEFVLLYRLAHASRFPRDAASAHECLLEHYYQQGIDEGGRVRDKLRDGVEEALRVLGTAFLTHPDSGALREKLARGQLEAPRYYRQLLRLVYRFLFLMVAEERRMIFPPDETDLERQAVYSKYYSVARVRDRAERYFAGDRHDDLWLGLRETFRLFRDSEAAKQLGLRALDGELFGQAACADLEGAGCTNEKLLMAISYLSRFVDEDTGRRRSRSRGQRRRVNYAGLDVEEFGSVYESLLDYHPQTTLDPPAFDLVAGSERKQTGSYYTPPELVRELIQSALVPVVEERLAGLKTKEAKEQALVSLRVCDPAAGSGHFLLAAARMIGLELAKVRTREPEPTPLARHEATRDVIRTCIYAVDKNPLAVDLCKVALWIEGHNAGLPLSFLDHHVKCGDSLVGVFDLKALEQGIPDDAYKPVTGDDKQVASAVRNRNKQERAGQLTLRPVDGKRAPQELAPRFADLARREERTPDDVHAKEELYERLRAKGGEWWKYKVACDLWTAAFFTPLAAERWRTEGRIPTTGVVRKQLGLIPDDIREDVKAEAIAFSQRHPFFHWPLEFPDAFAVGGFDVVLGNPPWERIKLQEQEFFAGRDPEIGRAPNKAAREVMIRALPETNPALAAEFGREKYAHEAQSRFVRASGRFPLTAVGDVNTYPLFAELDDALHKDRGRAGVIVPTGIATDDTCKQFFSDLNERRGLVSLYDFENRTKKLFPSIDSRMKFSLLTMTGQGPSVDAAQFAFFLLAPEELRDPDRRFVLTPNDLALLNPNTRTCPVFRTRRDADTTRAIYSRVPVLIKDGPPKENPWGIRLMTMFHMSNDSHLFRTREQLQERGWRLEDNVFVHGEDRYFPLYEGRLGHQFNHRFATQPLGVLTEVGDPDLIDPCFQTEPEYWVPKPEVDARLSGRDVGCESALLGFRRVTNSTNERTVIACVFPWGAASYGWILCLGPIAEKLLDLSAMFNSLVFDYVARNSLSQPSMPQSTFEQLASLPPSTFTSTAPWLRDVELSSWLRPRSLELTYTAWDLRLFAGDFGHYGPPFRWDQQRRFLLRCELDAAFFHLYSIEREDVDYIMDTFPIVRRKDEQRWGEYRTKRVILEVYDEMARAMRTCLPDRQAGEPYQTRLDPPPADPRVAHADTRKVV